MKTQSFRDFEKSHLEQSNQHLGKFLVLLVPHPNVQVDGVVLTAPETHPSADSTALSDFFQNHEITVFSFFLFL